MNRFYLFLSFFYTSFSLFAQVPQKFSFQAVATDDVGVELVSKNISIRSSVISSSPSNPALYIEEFDITTDEFGLFTIEIGDGQRVGGSLSAFSDIPWGTDFFFLKVEIDDQGGSNFKFIGTKQLLSVPYALYAEKAKFADEAATAADDNDKDPVNEIQDLELNNGVLGLTGSGVTVDLSSMTDDDGDPTNELQKLQLNGTALGLTGDTTKVDLSFLNDADGDPANEIQSLVLNGTQLGLSGDPTTVDLTVLADGDGDPTNEIQNLTLNGSTIALSGSNASVDLSPFLTDLDPSNEIQDLQLNGTNLTLTGGTTTIDMTQFSDGDGDPTNELQHLSLDANNILTLSNSQTVIDMQPFIDGDGDATNEFQDLILDGHFLTMTNSMDTVDLSQLPRDDADANPTNEIQTLFISGDTLGISGGNTLLLSSALNGAGGFNDPGATIDFPQGVTNADYVFISDTVTVPPGKTFYITASEDEMILPGVGNDFGRHLTGPNMPIFGPNRLIDNCRCIGFFKNYNNQAHPEMIVLSPNQGNVFQVPTGKNFVIKSGLDVTTPITLNGRTINFFSGNLKALVIPHDTQIRNIGNDEVILTGYMIEDN